MSDISYIYMIRKCEEKLRELMGAEEYSKFAAEIARGAFKAEIDSMESCDFKDFVQSHFDEITADDYNPENFRCIRREGEEMTPEHMKTTPEDIDLDRMKDDTISRQAVLKLLAAIPPEEAMSKAMLLQSVKQMSAVQSDEEKISIALYNIYRNTSPHTSAEGVAYIKYYIAEIWREIFGEEGPIWLRK